MNDALVESDNGQLSAYLGQTKRSWHTIEVKGIFNTQATH
jgi:hypothetical protein